MTPMINRRTYLATLLAAGTATLGACATTKSAPKDYVLLHGAWHGGWAWDSVKPLLEGPGVRVFAMTLKGLAERQNENGPDVTLDTHIDEVIALMDRERMTNAVLVGHSYAGMVVTGVCDRRPERIAHVVYLDAFLPASGQRLYDMAPPERVAQARRETAEKGKGYMAMPPDAAAWGLTGAHLELVNRRMTPHPANTIEQPLVLTRGGPYAVPRRTYIDCTQPAMPPFAGIKQRVKSDPRWNYVTVDAGHEVMISHPQLLANILARIS